MNNAIFERDLLYPTNNFFEPGSVHLSILKPDTEGRLALLISPKTDHNPLDYADTIIRIIQLDIFNRVRIDIRSTGIFFFETDNRKYIKLTYKDGKPVIEEQDCAGMCFSGIYP
ncbi:MAG: hypothetical protein GX213_11215 [Clostridiaceae bacterium]|nr:hypothetical protein [Clostridiaceae bacterium]